MSDPAQEARNILNASGYLFQLRVRHEIESTQSDHGWRVSRWEEPWKHPEGGTGFTDLVVSEPMFGTRLVMECKRHVDGNWVFPISDDRVAERRHVRVLEVEKEERGSIGVVWHDLTSTLVCHESEFCVIDRKKGRQDLLEDVSRTLLDEVDIEASKAAQELRTSERTGNPGAFRVCIVPVVVTNALLSVVTVHLDGISLLDGKAPDDVPVEPVPFVRFRKTLALPGPSPIGARYHTDHRGPTERTVFVVQAQHIVEFLKGMKQL